VNNNKIVQLLLKEEEEEEKLLFSYLNPKKKKKVDILYQSRSNEGFFEILIERHLLNNEPKFREFFRVNRQQFDYLLSLVKFELTKPPSNRVKKPITAAEKLSLTLR